MQLFDKKFSQFLILIGIPILFLPKINLISLGNRETAGIRLDDFLLLTISILVFWAHFSLNKKMQPVEQLLITIVSLSLVSFLLNRLFVEEEWLHVDANIFYAIRIAEYFIFFYIGAMSIQFFKTSSIILSFFLWNASLMLLQRLNIIGQFGLGGYTDSDAGRVIGIASFPSETGMLIDLIFCYLIYNETPFLKIMRLFPRTFSAFLQQTYVYWLFLICSTLVIITGSRIAIFALIIIFLFRIKDDLKQRSIGKWVYGMAFIGLGGVLTFQLIANTDSISVRSSGLLSFKNLQLIEVVWDKIDLSYDPIGKEAVRFEDYDMSWWMRIHKWIYASKIYFTHPQCWLQGVGPGFAMAALDGGWLRILTELGLIGLFLFGAFFRLLSKQSKQMYWMIVAFSINMIFFDVYLAYKPMSFIFLVSGSTFAYTKLTLHTKTDIWIEAKVSGVKLPDMG